jgi:pilus assembly protein CpaE
MDDEIMAGREQELTALLVAPDRGMAKQFLQVLPQAKVFQVLSDLKTYLGDQALELRLRQWKPDVVLLDVSSDSEQAAQMIGFISKFRPVVHVIGLHPTNDPEAIMLALRMGASEFLHTPFDAAMQREAAARIRRLRQPDPAREPELATIVAFASTKPGSGASTLAVQTAFALRRRTGKRVLLVDFDLMGGTIGFYLKVRNQQSLVEVLAGNWQVDAGLWSTLTVHTGGVDVLPSPDEPAVVNLDPAKLHDLLEYARQLYDWVILDLPAVFHRTSLLCMSQADKSFLISTSELPSLHLTRKAITMLANLGFEKDRYRVVVNRLNRRDGLGEGDLEKMFSCPVFATFPNDYFALHRVVTLGEPLGADGDLGRSIDQLAGRLSGAAEAERKRGDGMLEQRPVLSQT